MAFAGQHPKPYPLEALNRLYVLAVEFSARVQPNYRASVQAHLKYSLHLPTQVASFGRMTPVPPSGHSAEGSFAPRRLRPSSYSLATSLRPQSSHQVAYCRRAARPHRDGDQVAVHKSVCLRAFATRGAGRYRAPNSGIDSALLYLESPTTGGGSAGELNMEGRTRTAASRCAGKRRRRVSSKRTSRSEGVAVVLEHATHAEFVNRVVVEHGHVNRWFAPIRA